MYIYIYFYMCVYIYVYIYVYIWEMEWIPMVQNSNNMYSISQQCLERQWWLARRVINKKAIRFGKDPQIHVYVYIYICICILSIYIYIYIYIQFISYVPIILIICPHNFTSFFPSGQSHGNGNFWLQRLLVDAGGGTPEVGNGAVWWFDSWWWLKGIWWFRWGKWWFHGKSWFDWGIWWWNQRNGTFS